jgi:hypothetical protein
LAIGRSALGVSARFSDPRRNGDLAAGVEAGEAEAGAVKPALDTIGQARSLALQQLVDLSEDVLQTAHGLHVN